MIEIIAALVGAIIGSALTLGYSSVQKNNARKREQQIIKCALLSECETQKQILDILEQSYNHPCGVNPTRFALDLFAYALHRHVAELGDVELIGKLSHLTVNIRALNTTLDRYEPKLLQGLEGHHGMTNVEQMRIGICNYIQCCKKALTAVRLVLESK